MNKVILMGRLAKNPNISYSQTVGNPVFQKYSVCMLRALFHQEEKVMELIERLNGQSLVMEKKL